MRKWIEWDEWEDENKLRGIGKKFDQMGKKSLKIAWGWSKMGSELGPQKKMTGNELSLCIFRL